MATKKLYRSKFGQVFGVCQGIADWRDLPVGPIRLIVIIAVVCTGIFPGVAIYLLAALFIPANPYETERPANDGSNWHRNGHMHGYSSETVHGTYEADDNDARSNDELKEEYERLKKKVEKMEEEMFDKERDWDQRFHEGN